MRFANLKLSAIPRMVASWQIYAVNRNTQTWRYAGNIVGFITIELAVIFSTPRVTSARRCCARPGRCSGQAGLAWVAFWTMTETIAARNSMPHGMRNNQTGI
jgi:hypothetical protein